MRGFDEGRTRGERGSNLGFDELRRDHFLLESLNFPMEIVGVAPVHKLCMRLCTDHSQVLASAVTDRGLVETYLESCILIRYFSQVKDVAIDHRHINHVCIYHICNIFYQYQFYQ